MNFPLRYQIPGAHGVAIHLQRLSRRLAASSQRVLNAAASPGNLRIAVACSALSSVGIAGSVHFLTAGAGDHKDDNVGLPRGPKLPQATEASSQQQQQPPPSLRDFGHPARRTTDLILVLNILVFLAQWWSRDALTLMGAKINDYIWAGQYWRLLTPAFLHGGVTHLAVNSYSLHVLGPSLEVLTGGPRFALIYTVSALCSTMMSVLANPSPSLGASGAIMGLGATLGVFYWRNRQVLGRTSDSMLQSLGWSLLLNVGLSIANRRMDNWGHLGGLLGGAVAAWLLCPRLVRSAPRHNTG